MIVFDLHCRHGHVFEGWFASSEDFADQQQRGLLDCPVCADTQISKAISTVNVSAKSNQKISLPARSAPVESAAHTPAAGGSGPTPEQARAFMAAMVQMQAQVEQTHDDVGDQFVEQVRAMHHGEIDERPILGDATLADAVELNEEGIDVMPLPFRRKRKRLSS